MERVKEETERIVLDRNDRRWEEYLRSKETKLILSHFVCFGMGGVIGGVTGWIMRSVLTGRPQEK